jgi:hypothetical protein
MKTFQKKPGRAGKLGKQIRGFRHGQNPLSLHPQAEALLHAVSFLEPLNTPGRIDKLLLTGKERVTGRADFRGDLGLGGTGQKRIAAQALDRYLRIFWVNAFFHYFLLA